MIKKNIFLILFLKILLFVEISQGNLSLCTELLYRYQIKDFGKITMFEVDSIALDRNLFPVEFKGRRDEKKLSGLRVHRINFLEKNFFPSDVRILLMEYPMNRRLSSDLIQQQQILLYEEIPNFPPKIIGNVRFYFSEKKDALYMTSFNIMNKAYLKEEFMKEMFDLIFLLSNHYYEITDSLKQLYFVIPNYESDLLKGSVPGKSLELVTDILTYLRNSEYDRKKLENIAGVQAQFLENLIKALHAQGFNYDVESIKSMQMSLISSKGSSYTEVFFPHGGIFDPLLFEISLIKNSRITNGKSN